MQENLAYARKVRPYDFDGYIGNENVKETVMRYLKRKRAQSILITGNSGCGKTTLGRIIEREYLCEERDPDKGACGECFMCQAMNEYIKTGRSDDLPDIYEIDCTESSSKSNINTFLTTIDYPANAGGWKVYLLDEVHKLSSDAMNRILKVLEEPPEMVLMILCTTNPELLLDTIKNRCQLKLAINKPSSKDLVGLLKRVCLEEDKEYDIQGLRLISARADFVIRDSLNDLETVINTQGDATAESVSKQFKEVTDKIIFEFYDAYIRKDYIAYAQVLYRIKVEFSFAQFLSSLTSFTTRGIYILNGVDVEGISPEELSSYLKLFKCFSIQDISHILSTLKRMPFGDVEANLLSFIYVQEPEKVETKSDIEIPKGDNGTASETKYRNNNLKMLETAKLREGEKFVTGDLQKNVSIGDMAGLFQLEKVSK